MNIAELLMRQGLEQKIPKRYQAPVQEFVKNVLQDGVVLYERMGKSFGESRGEAKLSKTSV